jgi:hypothetical protein
LPGRPSVHIWDYAVLDGNLITDEPIPVADGWELVAPSADELRRVLPMPTTAAYQPAVPFKPDDYEYFTMLRRVNHRVGPHHRAVLHWEVLYSLALDRPAYPLGQQFLLLGLFDR